MSNNIRNFSIIAHVDHGKSTLSNCLINLCLKKKIENRHYALDYMDLEKERGITIKSKSIMLKYKSISDKIYKINLIDTPGHVDFSYEVSRSLSACEGAILVIDSTQGVEAQTLANCKIAIKMGLKILPVINKIDLNNSNPEKVIEEIRNIIQIDIKDTILCSAKTGYGVQNILEKVVNYFPSPVGNKNSALQALIIDSWFDNYLGVVSLICIKNGVVCKGEKIKIMSTNLCYKVEKLGIFNPFNTEKTQLTFGEIGWISCSMKNIHAAPVGDTITKVKNPSKLSLPGFKKVSPKIYAGIYPVNLSDYKNFSYAIERLSLNDSSLSYESESSKLLGAGFKCGFLGLLHMDIIKERLTREYNLNLITTTPTVKYRVIKNKKDIFYINNPHKISEIKGNIEIEEPIAECNILIPIKYLGKIIKLCFSRRGIQKNIEYYKEQVFLKYEIPMNEILLDFFNCLKSFSNGYASLEYKFKHFKKSELLILDLIINKEKIESLTTIVHKKSLFKYSKNLIKNIKEFIPRHQFNINIQAVVGKKIIASTKIKQFRKNVIEKCYGGDINRKIKLLNRQKMGKKNMNKFNKIKLPREIFIKYLYNSTKKNL